MPVPRQPIRSVCLRVLCLFALLAPASQADVAAARQALQAGNYASALSQFQVDARQGDAAALYELGRMYEKGQGVPPSRDTAIVLYRVAYLQGDRNAEAAVNRLANDMSGAQIANAVQNAAQLQRSGRFVPVLPGAPPVIAAPTPAPATPPAPAATTPPAATTAPSVTKTPPPAASAAPSPASKTIAAAPTPAPAAAAAARPAEFKYACTMQLRYQDKGSGGRYDMALYQPQPEPGYYLLGGYAQGNYDAPNGCTLTMKPAAGTEGTLWSAPIGWERVWKDKGTGAVMDGSVWKAVPRSNDFVCLGHVGQTGKEQPVVSNYACVNRCMTQTAQPSNPLWTTERTGAAAPLEVYVLPHLNSFVGIPNGQRPDALVDLNPDATCP